MTRRQDQQRPKQMIRETFQYFEACTWFGPEHEKNIGAANASCLPASPDSRTGLGST